MNFDIQDVIVPLVAFLIPAIGLLIRELHYRKKAKRLATEDATKTLNQKKALFENMISKTQDDNTKQILLAQLDEVNAVLLGLYAEKLRHTLKEAGLPAEEILTEDGRRQLQPKQVADIMGLIEVVKTLPPFLSTKDLLVLGNAYYYMEQYQDAKNIYDKILKLNPNDPEILHNRGNLYNRIGKYNEALADYNHSLEIRPDYPETLNNRGHSYHKLDKYYEAIADFTRAIELKPDYLEAFYNRGTVYAKLERYDEALADFNRALEITPNHHDTLVNRGIAYAKLEKYDEALADYNYALELSPGDPNTLYNLACLFSLWGKPDDALAYLEKAIKGDEKYREDTKTDEDFNNVRDDPRFKKLTESD